MLLINKDELNPKSIFGIDALISKEFIKNFTCDFLHNESWHINSNNTERIKKIYSHMFSLFKNNPHSDVFFAIQDRFYFIMALSICISCRKKIYFPNMLTSNAIRQLMHDYDAILITDIDELSENIEKCIIISEDKFGNTLDDISTEITFPQDVTLNFFTSGSSGFAKVIPKKLSHLVLELSLIQPLLKNKQTISCDVNPFQCEQIIHATVSHQHIYGFIFTILYPLMFQNKINRHTYALWENLFYQLQNGDIIVSSAAHLGRFPVDFRATVTPSIILSSGSLLSFEASYESYKVLNCVPIEIYGSTETGGIAYRQQINNEFSHENNETKNQFWTSFDHIHPYEDDNGCLTVTSPCLTDDTVYKGKMNTFHTSDLVTFVENKKFYLNGRADNIIKVEGKRISLEELILKLKTHDLIFDACAVLLESSYRTEIGVVAILSSNGQKMLIDQTKKKVVFLLRESLSTFFEPIFIPKKWRFVDILPRNNQGKIIKTDILNYFKQME